MKNKKIKLLVGIIISIVLIAGVVIGYKIASSPKMKVLADKLVVSLTGGVNPNWINPCKVEVRNISGNKIYKIKLAIHNGSKKELAFVISERYPDFTEEAYERLDDNNGFYVIPTQKIITIAPSDTKDIEIIVGANKAEKLVNSEGWISITTNTGSYVGSELCLRCLIKVN